jgi:hypothetical protein
MAGAIRPSIPNGQTLQGHAPAIGGIELGFNETSPANICKERDFNRIESDSLPQDALESALSKFEDLVGSALTQIQESPESIVWGNWNTLLNFMALLAVRNPTVRKHANKRATEQWIRAIEDATNTPARHSDSSSPNWPRGCRFLPASSH